MQAQQQEIVGYSSTLLLPTVNFANFPKTAQDSLVDNLKKTGAEYFKWKHDEK